ncbi:peptidase A22B, signal peptide peptidase [Sporodiniella umbellata]|nr:peptidase A22B, signal peptide peptidase [Sporodiniella umbellata]
MGTRFFTTTENWLSTTSAFLGLLALAVTPIWIGSFVSLSVVKKKDKGVRFEPEKTRILSAQHALAFPIVGSIAVFYTYLALKSIDPEYINDGIVIIASILTTALFSNTLLMIAKNNMSSSWIEKIENYKFSFSKQGNEVFNIHITTIHLLVMVISIALSAVYTLTQHWIVGNIFAICIVINIMGLFAVDSFWTGFFLMCGMLFHDILWMSGSETISKISESFSNAPLNIVWPRHVETFVLDKLVKDNQMFTMFSTTDIVIPGRLLL